MNNEILIKYEFGKYVLYKYYGDSAKPIIPEKVEVIDERAFENCGCITSIHIPPKVEEIRYKAFSGCANLKSVVMEGARIIGDNAFEGCISLTNVQIPELTSKIKAEAFSGCRSLKSIIFPERIDEIEGYAFYQCENLTQIFFQESLCRIDIRAFVDCNNLKIIRIGNDIFTLEDYVYKNFSYSDPPEIYNGIEYQYDIDSEDSEYLVVTSEIREGDTVNVKFLKMTPQQLQGGDFKIFNGNLIQYRGKETEIIIPESVNTIGAYSFMNNQTIRSVTIPKGAHQIRSNAFSGCGNLESITIGEGLSEIGDSAFSGCSSLKSIEIPESVSVIGASVFFGCRSLISIRIPESVNEIGFYAFSGCSKLTSIVIPEDVIEIGENAFSDCRSLTSIAIPESVQIIGKRAFSGCSSLTSIAIPISVIWIGESAFSGCTNLESIEIPESVTSIVGGTFSKCSKLTSIVIPEGVIEISENAFSDCKSLKQVTIPSSVKRIDPFAFSGCENLVKLEIMDGAEKKLKYAFRNCNSLTEIILHGENGRIISKFNGDFGQSENIVSDLDTIISDSSLSIEEKIQTVLARLQPPYELETDSEDEYRAFLQNIMHYRMPILIKKNDIETIHTLAGLNLFYRQDIDDFIEQANHQGQTEIQAFLMDYKNKTWGHDSIPGFNLGDENKADEWLTHQNSDGSLTIQKYLGSDVNVTIPAKIEGNPVKKIDGWNIGEVKINVFSTRRDKVETVVIEDGIEVIGSRTFLECHNLGSLTIPASVREIGKEALYGCEKLVIRAPKGSFAIEYARKNDIRFEEI